MWNLVRNTIPRILHKWYVRRSVQLEKKCFEMAAINWHRQYQLVYHGFNSDEIEKKVEESFHWNSTEKCFKLSHFGALYSYLDISELWSMTFIEMSLYTKWILWWDIIIILYFFENSFAEVVNGDWNCRLIIKFK